MGIALYCCRQHGHVRYEGHAFGALSPTSKLALTFPLSVSMLISVSSQVIPRFAEELCRKDLGSWSAAGAYGINLIADMHRRGIGVRHVGLIRDMFWGRLQGNVDLSFNLNRIRTYADMRLQLHMGDQVRVTGL